MADVLDPASADTVLTVEDPNVFHNGEQIAFGPDGYLHISVGDDGNATSARDNSVLQGKILRIDQDGNVPGSTLTQVMQRPGRRSGHRVSATPGRSHSITLPASCTSAMWGRNSREEIDVRPASSAGGEDYGWKMMEGLLCVIDGCSQTGLVLPTHEYTHADGCSITGGFVYRGSQLPMLVGHYLYSDYCTGFVKSFRYSAGQALDHQDWTDRLGPGSQVTSFGEDGMGELYIMRLSGEVYRIVAL